MVSRLDSLNSWLSSLSLKIGHRRRTRKSSRNAVPRSSSTMATNDASGFCRSTTFPTLGKNYIQ